jgi:hypothetical protein
VSKFIALNLLEDKTIITLFKGDVVEEEFEVIDIAESFKSIEVFFNKNSKYYSYIFISQLTQTFTYRVFPPIDYFTLQKLVDTTFKKETVKDDLKYKKFVKKDKDTKKSTFLFLSNQQSDSLKQWLKLFNESFVSILNSIYIVPFEISYLSKTFLKKKGIKDKNCNIILYEDSSNIVKQIIIFKENIILAKTMNVDFTVGEDEVIRNNIKNELFKDAEFLRRYDMKFTHNDLIIISVLENRLLKIFEGVSDSSLNIQNYSVKDFLSGLGFKTKPIKETNLFADSIVKHIKTNSKSVKFYTKEIKYYKNLILTRSVSRLVSFILLFVFLASIILSYFFNYSINNELAIISIKLTRNERILNKELPQQLNFSNKTLNILMDFGTLKEVLETHINPIPKLQEFKKVVLNDFLIANVKIGIDDFKRDLSNYRMDIKFIFDGALINKKGDIVELKKTADILKTTLRQYSGRNIIFPNADYGTPNKANTYFVYPFKIEVSDFAFINTENTNESKRQRRNTGGQ